MEKNIAIFASGSGTNAENISNSNCYDSRKIESTGLFIKWIVNYYPDKLKEKRLRHALKTYVHTVLPVSYTHLSDITLSF